MRTLLLRNRLKMSLNTVTMVTKILTCYISVTVSDRPIVTIIHREEDKNSYIAFHFAPRPVTCGGDREGHKATFINFTKNAFSQSVF